MRSRSFPDNVRHMNPTICIAACFSFALLSTVSSAQGTSKTLTILAKGAAPDGAWKWELQFLPGSDKCAASGKRECGTEVVYIQNGSSDVIECSGFVEYQGRKTRHQFQTRISAKDSWSDPIILDAYGLTVKAHDITCAKFVPEPVLRSPEGCNTKSEGASPVDFYPKASQKFEETGVVRVRVTLENPRGKATQLRVVDRSAYKRLDDAALKFAKALTFTTTCAPTIFDIPVHFTLSE